LGVNRVAVPPMNSVNGNEYLKRQLTKRGVAFEALDNGVKVLCQPQADAAAVRRNVGGQDSID
jgi:hypothetical protein